MKNKNLLSMCTGNAAIAKKLRFAGLHIAVFICFAMMYSSAGATVYNVTNTADGNATNQLRGALSAADAAGGTHTINVAAGTYTLTLGEIAFGNRAENITITGAGSGVTTINMGTGVNQDRIFLINPPGTNSNIVTTISGITFTNGHLKSDIFGGGAIIAGGPNSSLTITGCTFQNNMIDAGLTSSAGGAICFTGGGALTIDQCSFSNNTAPATTTNSSASGAGGAIYFGAYGYNDPSNNNIYTYPNNSLSVTNSTFSGNTAGSYQNLSGQGGAINVSAAGFSTVDPPRPTLSVTIRENNFISNSVTGTGGTGGAIAATNSFSTTNTFLINYNRFYNNTAGSGNGSALISFDTQGNVDATNNWWGCNSGPFSCADKAYRFPGSSTGTLTTTPYLQLRSSSSSTNLCGGTTATITSGFTVNSTGTAVPPANLSAFVGLSVSFSATLGTVSPTSAIIQSTGTATTAYTAGATAGTGTINAVADNVPATDATARALVTITAGVSVSNPANTSACTGNPVSFSTTASGSGTLSYQWYKGTIALSNGATGTGSIISGATTATLTITNPSTADNASNYNVQVSSTTGCITTSGNATLTIAAPNTATATTSGSKSISSTNTIISDASCNLIATVTPSGTAAVSGSVSATVTIAASVQVANGRPYGQRHYDIVPSVNPSTATGTITLYFTQPEFTAYNSFIGGSTNLLPVNATDAANNKANIRIIQFHGTGTAPGNYSGTTEEINPADNNIVWSSTYSRWEITFSVTGFSGFYLTTPFVSITTNYFRTAASGSWNSAATWESSYDNTAFYPATLSPDFNANNITIQNTHTVTLNDQRTIDQLAINAGGVLLAAPATALTLNDGSGNDITIATGGSLVLQSASTGTARVAQLPPGAAISGTVTVERYIPSRRAWRLMTSPLSNTNTIYQAWQNGGVYTAGIGTFVTGPGGGNGLDNSNSYSLKTYNIATGQLENVANTNTGLSSANGSAENKGYFLFVRGDRNPANLTAPNTNITTLSSKGSVQTGTQAFSATAAANSFMLIGNPYASPVDFNLITRTANIPKRFYAWDPSLNTVGGYVTLDDADDNGTYSISPSSTQTNILQSSQAFFVQAASAGTATVTFNESNKSAVSTNAGFRTNDGTTEVLRTTLYLKNADNTATLADGVLSEYQNNYSAAVNIEDAVKMTNINENLAMQRDGHLLSIERRPLVDGNDTLYLNLTNTTARDYSFTFEPSNFATVVSAKLEDTYLNTSTPLSITAPTVVNFSITSNIASAAADRFRIVFKTSGVLPVNFTTVKAYQQNAGGQVEWSIASEINTKNYEVEKSTDGRAFINATTVTARANNNTSVNYNWFDATPANGVNYYRIKAIENSGSTKLSQVVSVKIGGGKSEITVYPNPVTGSSFSLQFTNEAKGFYMVELFNSIGQMIYSKSIEHQGGSATQTINPGSAISKGVYQLHITNGENKITQQVVIN